MIIRIVFFSKLKLHDLFKKHLKNQTDKNTDAELAENKEVVDFMETIWTQHYGSESQVEPASSLQSDDEIEMTQVDQTKYICPITKVSLYFDFLTPIKHISNPMFCFYSNKQQDNK